MPQAVNDCNIGKLITPTLNIMKHIIIGGGVIGLSIAYELSRRGQAVVLLEKDHVGQKASWAGAGILPPANGDTAIHPLEKLEAFSNDLHLRWARELKTTTGIDTGFRKCGGWYLARTAGESAALLGLKLYWEERGIKFEVCDHERLLKLMPALTLTRPAQGVFLPDEWQLRNPHHLAALHSACLKNGVQVIEECESLELIVNGCKTMSCKTMSCETKVSETECVRVDGRDIIGDNYCVTGGAWSESLIEPFGVPLPMTPVRGQMVLFKLPTPPFSSVVNEGTRYLVPRDDGHVLAGATIEEVGFDCRTVDEDIAELAAWAGGLMPHCNSETLVTAWAGLRPGTYDGFPYLGSIGHSTNSWVASGHFKAGLHLSTGTAVMMADLMEGKPATIDLTPFAPSRAEFHLAQPIS